MVALAADRNTPERSGTDYSRPSAANVRFFKGALVCLNATGDAVPGSTATTLVADGVAVDAVDNTGGSAGAKSVQVKKGTFRFANSAAGDAITKAEIGDTCFVVDDQTVAKTNGTNTRSAAGTVVDVDAQGVWVRIA